MIKSRIFEALSYHLSRCMTAQVYRTFLENIIGYQRLSCSINF